MAIIYDVGFRVQTNGLKSQIQTINNDINKAFELRSKGELGKEVERGVVAASQLKAILQQATTDKGLSFVTLNAGLKSANMSATELVKTLSSAGMKDSVNTFLSAFLEADRTVLSLNKKVQELGRVFTQSFKFSIAQQSLRFLQSTFDQGIQWSKDMNAALTNIAIVTGQSGEALDRTYGRLVDGAAKLRVAASDYAEAALIFYQQGLSDEEVSRRTDITIMAAKAAGGFGASISEMSKQLTAVWNTYGMVNDELERAASISAKLGAETAVDMSYIAEAMQIAATAASQMGVEYESLAAIIATTGETTLQSASVVGNAFKTIFSRFQQLKSDGTDGEVTLGLISSQLQDLGINVLDAAGELRELDDVILEVGTSWETYSDKQQLAIAQLVGGTRQYTQFLALMQNFDKYQTNLASAQSEIGGETLERQYQTYLNSIESMAEQAAEAWNSAFGSIINEDVLKAFYRTLRDIGNIFSDLIDGLGGVPGILGYVSSILISKIGPTFNNIVNTAKELWANRNTESQIAQSNKDLDTMITKLKEASAAQATLTTGSANTGAPDGTSPIGGAGDNSILVAKLEMTKELVSTQIQLQEVQQNGSAVEQTIAGYYREQLVELQKVYNVALDKVRAAESDITNQQRIVKELSNQTKQSDKVQKGYNNISKTLLTITSTLEKSAVKNKGVISEEAVNSVKTALNELDKSLNKVSSNSDLSKFQNQVSAAFTTIKEDGSNTIPVLEELLRAYQALGGTDLAIDANIETLEGNSAAIDNVITKLKEWLEAQNDLKLNQEDADNVIAGYTGNIQSLSDTFSTAASGLVSMSVSVNTLTGLIMSGNGSLISYITSISMLAPAVIKSVSSVMKLTESLQAQLVLRRLLTTANEKDAISEGMLTAAKTLGLNVTSATTVAELKAMVAKGGLTITTKGLTAAIWANTAALLSNPIFWIAIVIVGVIAAIVALTQIVKKNSEATQDNAVKMREQADAAKEAKENQEELTKSYEDALKVYKEMREEYDKGEASASDLLEAQRDLRDIADGIVSDIDREKLALAELSGNYDAVTESVRAYQAEKDKTAEQAARNQFMADEAAFIDSMLKGTGRNNYTYGDGQGFKGYLAQINDGGLGGGDASKLTLELINNGDFQYITTEGAGAGDFNIKTKTQDAQELIAAYREAQDLLAQMQEQGIDSNSKIARNLSDWLEKSAENVESLASVLDEVEEYDLQKIFDDNGVVFNTDAASKSIGNFILVKEQYVSAAREAAEANNLDADAAERLALAYIDANDAVSQYAKQEAAISSLSESTGINENQLRVLAGSLEREGKDIELLFHVDFVGYDGQNLGDLKTYVGSQLDFIEAKGRNLELDFNITKAEEVLGLLSENMDREALIDLSNAIDWGNAEEGIIEFSEFMNMTFQQQQAYLQSFVKDSTDALLANLETIQDEGAKRVEELQKDLTEAQDTVGETSARIAKLQAQQDQGPLKLFDFLELQRLLQQEQIELQVVADTEQAILNVESDIQNASDRFTIEIQLMTNELREQLEEARDYLGSISSGGFTGTIEQQVDAFNKLNQALMSLRLEPLTEDFLALTNAEQDNVLQTQSLILAQNEYNQVIAATGPDSLDAQIAMKNLTAATAELFDLDSDNLQEYARHIQQVAKQSDLLSDSLADNQKAALQVATATIRANRAFIDLDGKIGDIKKAFQEATIGSERYLDAIRDIRGPMEDLLNVDPGTLGEAFLSNIEALDLLQEAVDGNIDALWELQQLAASSYLEEIVDLDALDITLEGLHELEQAIIDAVDAGWELGELPDPELDPTGFIEACQELIKMSGMTAEQANAYFKQLGFDVEFKKEPQEITTETTIPQTTEEVSWSYEKVPQITYDSDGNEIRKTNYIPKVKRTTKDTSYVETSTAIVDAFAMSADGSPIIDTVTNSGSAGTSGGRSMRSTPNRGSGGKGTGSPGSGGGGGGGGSTPTVSQTDVTERYRNISDSLTEVGRRLDRVSSAADKAFGMNRVRLLAQQNALIQQQAKLYQQLQKEAENYLRNNAGLPVQFGNGFISGEGGDQGVLQAMLATFGLSANFSSSGAVSNAEQLLSQLTAIADTKLKEIGTFVDGVWEVADEDAKESYELLTGMISSIQNQIGQVADTVQQIEDAFNQQVEAIHTWLSNEIQSVEYKLELRLSINAMDLRRIQFLLNRLGDRAFTQQMDKIDEMATNAIKNAEELIGSYEELNDIIEKINTGEMLTKEEFMSTFGGNIEAWNQFLESGGAYTQEMMDTLMTKAGQMQDVIEDLYSYSEQMFAVYHRALNVYIDDFDRLISLYDNHASMLDSWSEIWKVAGQPWRNQRLQVDLLNKSIDTQSSKVQGLQQKYEFLNQELANAEEHYRLAVATHGEDDRIAQESLAAWNELQAKVSDAQAEMMSGIAEMMNMIQQAAAEAASVIVNEFVEGLGGIFSEVDSALAMLAQKTSIDKFFLHEEDLEFELNKLLREIAKEMEGATNPELLANYEAWMEKVNELKESGAQLTQTELDILKAEFDLEKARAAWQESQANKNTLRLSRDASGNWNYVYSNDGSDDGDAEADIEQRIHNIRKMHRDAADEAAEMWLQVWAEYNKYIQEIDWQRYEQNEAYRKEVDTRMAWYEQQMDLYAVQIEKHNDAIDRSFTEMSLSVILDIDNMAEANDRYKQNNQEMTEALKRNHDEYQEKARETLEAVGISYEDLEATINRETAIIMAKNKENEESVKRLRETAHAELNAIMQKTAEWSQRWINEIQAVINKLNELIAKILEMQAAQAGSSGTDGNYLNYNSGTYDTLKAKETAGSLTPDEAAFLAELRMINEARSRGDTTWDDYSNSAEFLKKQREFYAKYPEYQYTYDTGGLATGPQIAGLALDGKKELVLKNEDTENILAAVAMQRASLANRFNGLGSRYNEALSEAKKASGTETTQPPVIIQADFPNVSARDEIEAAFNNLVNQAAQYEIKPRE